MTRRVLAFAVSGALLVGGIAVAAPASAASHFSDNFDRANAADLGSSWKQSDGLLKIATNKVANGTQSTGFALANGVSGNARVSVSADVAAPAANTFYAAVVANATSASDNLFVKVQGSGAGGFTRAYFYKGNNGTELATTASLTAFTQGRIVVTSDGTNVTLAIDTNGDGTADQAYSRTLSSSLTGRGVGIGVWGDARLDNFSVLSAPAAPTITVTPGVRSARISWSLDDGGRAPAQFVVAAQDLTTGVSGPLMITTSTGNSVVLTGLTPGHRYKFQMQAVNSVGTSVAVTTKEVVPYSVPGAPTALKAKAGVKSAVVSWKAPGNGGSAITWYKVIATDTTNAGRGGQVATTTGRSVTVPGLTPGDKYRFRVIATNTEAGPASAYSPVAVPLKPFVTHPAKVTIKGTAKVGRKLSAAKGKWGPSGVKFTYRWYANGKAVKGATASALTLKSAVRGKRITVKVTGAKTGYRSYSLTSARTAKVAAR